MAKTIVIKGVDYTANALDKVSFESVPCTGISFAESSYSILNTDPVEVEYSVTPADTTDAVIWESSDTDVVTVNNGIITANGIGTATVTATCGEYSASATVTVSIAYIPKWYFYYMGTGNNYTYTNSSGTGRMLAGGTGNQATEYVFVGGSGGADLSAIKLPKNTGRVKISVSDAAKLYNGNEMIIAWAKDESCDQQAYPQGIKKVSVEDLYNARTTAEKTFDVPEGADSLLVGTRIYPVPAEGTDPTTYAVSTIGLSITFLTAV